MVPNPDSSQTIPDGPSEQEVPPEPDVAGCARRPGVEVGQEYSRDSG